MNKAAIEDFKSWSGDEPTVSSTTTIIVLVRNYLYLPMKNVQMFQGHVLVLWFPIVDVQLFLLMATLLHVANSFWWMKNKYRQLWSSEFLRERKSTNWDISVWYALCKERKIQERMQLWKVICWVYVIVWLCQTIITSCKQWSSISSSKDSQENYRFILCGISKGYYRGSMHRGRRIKRGCMRQYMWHSTGLIFYSNNYFLTYYNSSFW